MTNLNDLTPDLVIHSLEDMRSAIRSYPRKTPGLARYQDMLIAFDDVLALYSEVRNILMQGIYDFPATRPDAFIIDGGAHLGVTALRFKHRHPQATVLCFEPSPEVLPLLYRNIAGNALSGVSVVEAGLAPGQGTSAFLPDGADGGRMMAEASGGTTVPTVSLSRYIQGRVDMLKLNIEGMEYPVLLELQQSDCLHHIDRMIIEYHGWPNASQTLGHILNILAENGFRYLIHDFDAETNPASKPPFLANRDELWFALIHARRVRSA
ncbi:FkbM family methyltransferase [Azospirillum formosense]|uniref:FkbM family methyltransferase n=1 Tax=Azospirillum formosense TaxID=861533 RepID=A0ABX2L163_9PROT|nr:FkbM family methyltransferase [Azospirillum formosense]MBY3757587.1 FkbM family methyltransferase [Azospirillum formosense]NUB19513.1 FkbM family methyltransferase [Azospirillum formosense]